MTSHYGGMRPPGGGAGATIELDADGMPRLQSDRTIARVPPTLRVGGMYTKTGLRSAAQKLGQTLARRRQHDAVLRSQDVAGMEVPDEPGALAFAVLRRRSREVRQSLVGLGRVERDHAPGSWPERPRDRTTLQLRVPGDVQGGEEQYATLDGYGTENLPPHHGPGEGRRREGRDAAGAGEGARVGGAQGAVDRGGEFVVVQPQGHAEVRCDRPRVQGRLQVGRVVGGESEQGLRPVDSGGFQYPFLRGVTDDGGDAQATGERDATCFGVLLHKGTPAAVPAPPAVLVPSRRQCA